LEHEALDTLRSEAKELGCCLLAATEEEETREKEDEDSTRPGIVQEQSQNDGPWQDAFKVPHPRPTNTTETETSSRPSCEILEDLLGDPDWGLTPEPTTKKVTIIAILAILRNKLPQMAYSDWLLVLERPTQSKFLLSLNKEERFLTTNLLSIFRRALQTKNSFQVLQPKDRYEICLASSRMLGSSEMSFHMGAVRNVIECFNRLVGLSTLGLGGLESSPPMQRAHTSASTPPQEKRRKTKSDISISSTTAHTTAVPAGVRSCKTSPKSIYDAIRLKYQKKSLTSGTSSVNSYITVRMGDSSQVCTLETEKSEFLIQLRCWKTSQLEGLSDLQKLKHAYASIHLYTDATSDIH
jgi:hypothetical protein